MKIVKFDEVKEELQSHFRRKMLVPVLGSGFTKSCVSYKGCVPSGEEYRQYMIEQLKALDAVPEEEFESLKELSFSEVCEYYYEVVDYDIKKNYLKDNFTSVILPQNRRNFLNIDWLYIYTLNIDDAIEKNSQYTCVICSNRKVNKTIFEEEKCVVKLHGDVWEMIKYHDDKTEIFSKTQYVNSLYSNTTLLSRLKHDSTCQNLIYIGCSLNDEIDLLSIQQSEEIVLANRYICLTKEPTALERIKYKKYGITHCVLFESFDSIYDELYELYKESQKISCDELSQHQHFSYKKCVDRYEDNKSYFLFGKTLLNKQGEVTYPYYFISRKISDDILLNMKDHCVQFLMGRRCSGKTYVLFDLVYKIRDKDLYIFESKDKLTDQAFESLLTKRNVVVLFDNASLSKQQVEYILRNIYLLQEKNIKIVISTNKNDREIAGILSLFVQRGIISKSDVPIVDLNNVFSEEECELVNPLLAALDIGVFKKNQTMLDNIMRISRDLNEKNRYNSFSPKTDTIKQLVSIIALLTERKIYSSRAIMFDIHSELELQRKSVDPLIDLETTWSYERNSEDPSTLKYVLNAEYWLCDKLSDFSKSATNKQKIVEAYKYIIEQIIANGEGPILTGVNEKGTYKEYILFDNINRIFNAKDRGYKGLQMVQAIYEGLNELLAVDPNYMHQRAKCYIKLAHYEKDNTTQMEFLNKAYRDVNVAIQIFQQRYDESANEHILISIDHLKYTKALIACHRCSLACYKNTMQNTEAIYLLHEALTSQFNSYEYAKQDTFNYGNVVLQLVTNALANQGSVEKDASECLKGLFKLLSA